MNNETWRATLRREGYVIMSGDDVVAVCTNRDRARAIASLPDLLSILADVEDYFGDRPRSDTEALELHDRMLKVLGAADMKLHSV